MARHPRVRLFWTRKRNAVIVRNPQGPRITLRCFLPARYFHSKQIFIGWGLLKGGSYSGAGIVSLDQCSPPVLAARTTRCRPIRPASAMLTPGVEGLHSSPASVAKHARIKRSRRPTQHLQTTLGSTPALAPATLRASSAMIDAAAATRQRDAGIIDGSKTRNRRRIEASGRSCLRQPFRQSTNVARSIQSCATAPVLQRRA